MSYGTLFPHKTLFINLCRPLLAFMLVFSLVLHAGDTHHAHPGHNEPEEHHSSPASTHSEYAHMEEKKFIFILVLIFLFETTLLTLTDEATDVRRRYTRYLRECTKPQFIFWQHVLFTTGILNPKLH